MRRLLAVALACTALAGCGELGKRMEAAKKRTEAAAKRMEAARQKRVELEREAGALRQKLDEATAKQQARRLELQRTLAAADYLKKAAPEVAAAWDTENAAAAANLEAAVAAKDASRTGRIVAQVTRRRLPCVGSPEAADGPDCDPEPVTDACAGVSNRLDISPTWKCDPPLLKVAGLPTLAVCKAQISHPASTDVANSPWAERGLATELTVLRTVFLSDSQLHMADFPSGAPNLADLYFPANVEALANCHATNEHAGCTHRCDVEFGRWQNPCAPSYGDGGEGHYDGDGYGYEPEGEDPSVRAARLEAERAEAEAREAEQRLTAAREEVRYQECLTGCEPPSPSPDSETPSDAPSPPPVANRVEDRLQLVRSPAPGLLLVENDIVDFMDTRPLSAVTSTLLLRVDAYADLLEKGNAGTAKLEPLAVLAEVKDTRTDDLFKKLSISEKPDEGAAYAFAKIAAGTVFAGVQLDGVPIAFLLSTEKGKAPATPFDRQNLCTEVTGNAAAFGAAAAGLAAACDRAIKAEAEVAALRTALAAVADAEALKAWRADYDKVSPALFTQAQKNALLGELSNKRAELAKVEIDQHKAKLAALEFKDAKDWKAGVDGSAVLEPGQKRDLVQAFDKRKPALAKAQLDAITAQLAAAEDRAALDRAKADLDASVLFDSSDKRKVEKALEKRRAELKKDCKLDGADACPAADAGGAP